MKHDLLQKDKYANVRKVNKFFNPWRSVGETAVSRLDTSAGRGGLGDPRVENWLCIRSPVEIKKRVIFLYVDPFFPRLYNMVFNV